MLRSFQSTTKSELKRVLDRSTLALMSWMKGPALGIMWTLESTNEV